MRLAAVLLAVAAAWDQDGHEAIGMTTMSALQAKALAQVKRLLGGKDVVDVAAWAHKVNKKYPWTTALHFQEQKDWQCDTVDKSVCPDNRCLTSALRHFYGKLAHKPELSTIEYPDGLQFTDADSLKFLINLIGDLHQPMHLGFEGDSYGRNISLSFRTASTSLFDMWDKDITQSVMKDNAGFWWSGWTHIHRVKGEYERDKELWDKNGVAMFDTWAQESLTLACDTAYRNPVTKDKLSPQQAGSKFDVSTQTFEAWKTQMLNKILLAGARTAIVLNDILKQREATTLGQGTGVKIEGEEDEKIIKRAPPPHWMNAFGTNMCIMAVVVGLFLFVMKKQSGGAPKVTLKADGTFSDANKDAHKRI